MKHKEYLSVDSSDKIISSDQLQRLLISPPEGIVSQSGERISILLDGYTIEDEHIILDDSIPANLQLFFINCTFNSGNAILIDGLVCSEDIEFEQCRFSNSIFSLSGTFKKKSSF